MIAFCGRLLTENGRQNKLWSASIEAFRCRCCGSGKAILSAIWKQRGSFRYAFSNTSRFIGRKDTGSHPNTKCFNNSLHTCFCVYFCWGPVSGNRGETNSAYFQAGATNQYYDEPFCILSSAYSLYACQLLLFPREPGSRYILPMLILTLQKISAGELSGKMILIVRSTMGIIIPLFSLLQYLQQQKSNSWKQRASSFFSIFLKTLSSNHQSRFWFWKFSPAEHRFYKCYTGKLQNGACLQFLITVITSAGRKKKCLPLIFLKRKTKQEAIAALKQAGVVIATSNWKQPIRFCSARCAESPGYGQRCLM